MKKPLAYARFAANPVWHALVDVEHMETACGFRFVDGRTETRPHLGLADELCGVCEDELGQAKQLNNMQHESVYDGSWRPTDAR